MSSKVGEKLGESRKNKALAERNRIILAYFVLAKDKTFQRLSEESKQELIKEVIAIGDEMARWVAGEYQTSDPRKIAAQMGISIFGEEKPSLRRSEYRKEKKEIAISRKFHQKLLDEVRLPELSEHLLKLVVAHELFHHLEAERLGEVYRRFKFKIFQIGPLEIYRQIKGLSEVAAQAFTHTLLDLKITPEIFDYLLNFLV